jgi:outer membrane protein
MLSKINLALNVLLLAAVAFLFFKPSTHVNSKAEKFVNEDDSTAVFTPAFLNSNSRVVFVNADSLNEKYEFIAEKYEELEREQLKIESQVQRKMKAAEERYIELEGQAAYMTPGQLEQAQLELQGLQMEISQFQEKLAADFRKKELETQQTFYKNISQYLKEYNKDGMYDFILTYQLGGQILLANDSLDITNDVIRGLNANYRSTQAKKVK